MPIIAGRASAAYGAGFGAVTTIPYAGPFGAYDALASVTLSSTTNTVSLIGIPSGYKHLQLRGFTLTDGLDNYVMLRFNEDSSSSYSIHDIYANGTNAFAGAVVNGTHAGAGYTGNDTFPAPFVCDILDYSTTQKFKTVRALGGSDRNGSTAYCTFISSNWRKLESISRIDIVHGNIAGGKVFNANTTFSLYGVK
jgi:hypothetical protein